MAVVREKSGPVERVRALALAYAGLGGGVLIVAVADPPAVLLATAADTGLDAGRILKSAIEANGGRGGGPGIPQPRAVEHDREPARPSAS